MLKHPHIKAYFTHLHFHKNLYMHTNQMSILSVLFHELKNTFSIRATQRQLNLVYHIKFRIISKI